MALWPCWRAWWSTTRPCTPKSLDANPALSLQDSVVSSFKSPCILRGYLSLCFTCCMSDLHWSPCRPDKVLRANRVSGQSSNRDAEGASGGTLRGWQNECTLCLPGVRDWADNGAGGEVQVPSVWKWACSETLVFFATWSHQAEGWEVWLVCALHCSHWGEISCEHAPPWPQPAGQWSI